MVFTQSRQLKAFSLIELMVVIAIVAVLAAIAVPHYREHVVKSRIQLALPTIDKLINKSITFANANGRFPTQFELGIYTVSPHQSVAATHPPYTLGWGDLPIDTCGRVGVISLYWNGPALGLPASTTVALGNFYFLNVNGVIKRWCAFIVGDSWGGPWSSTKYIPGCASDENAVGSGNQYTTEYIPLYNASSCM